MDHSTTSISEARITLRDDLRFRTQQFRGKTCYVIEDPTSSSYYRVGEAEYTLISLFDGHRSLGEVLQAASSVLGRKAFTEQDAAVIAKWLVEAGLAKTQTVGEVARLHRKAGEKKTAQQKQRWNPIITKFPLFRPERMLDRCAPWFSWTTTRAAFLIWFMTVSVALFQLLSHVDRLASRVYDVLTPDNWLWLGLTWLMLKFVHESFHALYCRKYGGEVREAGVVLIAFAPIFYVDVTSSWRFASKWQRMMVAAAGMYVEVFVGAVATLVWIHTQPGTVNQVALSMAVLSTITTVIFNANPLMRFDGYYLLSDALEIPNLATRGQQYLNYWSKKYVFGATITSPLDWSAEGGFIRCYGVAAFVWRILITISIGIVLATLFHGVGLILAAGALFAWIAVPLVRSVRYLVLGDEVSPPNRAYFAALATVWGVSLALACSFAPWPFAVKAPGVVEYLPGGIVRTEVSGFVRRVHAKPGQVVQAGDLLVELDNERLRSETKRLELALAASRKRVFMASKAGDIASQKIELENRRKLESQLEQRRQQLGCFRICSPIAGVVVADELASLHGMFLEEGTELMTVGDESRKQIRLSVEQQDSDHFATHLGTTVNVTMRAGERDNLRLPLQHIDPSASTAVEHLSLTVAGGGRIPVQRVGDGDDWEFLRPRLSGRVKLPADDAKSLRAGQLALVKLPTARSTLGAGLRFLAEEWFRTRWRLVQTQSS